ncbi:hypothetical protein SARC_12782 [Sphaeroforma arctica JP610]|uniref:Uncharacterized protein n=1 Tax=Sphaeroforma arctica JP610 TaxID=667725 RepID=A0A0L0FD51_9EUKA|nr:hypothetical protein SARC_12782 [Sphaeroforma arctica JP610]KNC74677.1 hypothetical protein SARC_12782 [Sphaeroforma arctica JP610]|eukprot:XP_014148579.1 hypothetical protein SARC_12782 [Sphaeroforma arctica JP610]
MPKPPAGAMCLLATSTDSKFEGKYLAAWYNRDSERTECFTTSGDQDNCEAYETGADCEDQIVFFTPDGTSPVKECVENLTYYDSGE